MVNFEDSIAHEAHSLVHGDRAKSYGHPRFDFRVIAKVWSGLMQDLLKDGVELDEYRVAVMMSGLKLCRLVKSPAHHDSRVDTIGYMLTMERLDEPVEPVVDEKNIYDSRNWTGPDLSDWNSEQDKVWDRDDPAVVDAAIKAYTTGEYKANPVIDGPTVDYKHPQDPDPWEMQQKFEEHYGQDGEAVWSGNLGNPSDNDVAVAMDVLARRQAFHDEEAAKLLKPGKRPRNG
jgi:hypothetical protein